MARKKSAEPPQVRAIKKSLRAAIGPPETGRKKGPDEREKLRAALAIAEKGFQRLITRDAWLDRRIRETEKTLPAPKPPAPGKKPLRGGKVALIVRLRPGLRELVRKAAADMGEEIESLATRAIRNELVAIRNYQREIGQSERDYQQKTRKVSVDSQSKKEPK